MIRRLVALLPDRLVRAATRHAVLIAIVGILLLAGLSAAVAGLVSPSSLGITAARLSETAELPEALRAAGIAARDGDRDGVSDALENYLYGADPEDWNSSGLGIPDGWLVQFGYDPRDPFLAQRRGAAPPPEVLPPAYAGGYPVAFTPPLRTYYAYGMPADYRPGEDVPWWRGGPHADPSRWDQAGTGIPTGWLLHHGLDVLSVDPDRVAAGSLGNLTLREAFAHNTDPLQRDSDGDGLDDWMEIHASGTDPARFSTSGAAIADGWLVHHGLNPFDPHVASQDPDLDGLTNREEFLVSRELLAERVARGGIRVLLDEGLHPLEWDTLGTGIPDGWYVRYGLDPFTTDVDEEIGRASAFPEVRDLDGAPEGHAPLPDLVMTARDAYAYGRPSDWNESRDGVWWGGTNPVTLDTDGDGLPDPVEIRGWYANVTLGTGPEAQPQAYLATSNPLEADADGDGLLDLEEYRGRADCGGGLARAFPPTDPRNRDTAFSGLTDYEKVCGAALGATRYDFLAEPDAPFLDPTKADSAGDHLRDGPALRFWHDRWTNLTANPAYPYPGSAYRTVFDWTSTHARFQGLSRAETLSEFRPDGDVDGDGLPNALDPDPSGGLAAARSGSAGEPATKVYFLGGPQIDPALYRYTEFASVVLHAASDPANPDTDGDGLPDAWETRHGRFDAARGGWNLDPAKADSDGDGVSDADANNDGDVVTWYAYDRKGDQHERTAHAFVFTNLLEHLAGTDPNTLSTAADGVSDGWKAFWGSRITSETYPSLVAARDARLGQLVLQRVGDVESAIATSPVQPMADLSARVSKTTGYVRFVNLTSAACDAARAELEAGLKGGETLEPGFCYVGENLQKEQARIGRVHGVFELTFRKEEELRTNPFLDDTDGDASPDAYEAYFMRRTSGGSAHPDPTLDDGGRDADGDGVGLREECQGTAGGRRCGVGLLRRGADVHGLGADPHAGDTDRDGVDDGIEIQAGLDPLDPSDVARFSDESRDDDGDGIPDYLELTGWGKLDFGVPVRTDPGHPDTDGDGLLDGPTRTLDPRLPAHGARAEAWKRLGIAHRAKADGAIDFLGERTYGPAFGVRPDRLDSHDLGIPDGWLAYHNQNPAQASVDPAAYRAFRPGWWDEALHGVWWWGLAPGAAAAQDLDHDGLHDAHGEDPFPFRQDNRIRHGDDVLDDPALVEDWVRSASTAALERERAQALGDGAGDPVAAREAARARVNANDVPVRLDRARVAILDLAVEGAGSPAAVTKGVPFNVTGRVVLDERAAGHLLEGAESDRVGVANRTVYASLFRPARETLVGIGFTDANGTFRLQARIAETVAATIPARGIVALGSVDGVVSASVDPALAAPGRATSGVPNRLVVWVANTSATVPSGHPTHAPHQAMLPDAQGQTAQRTTVATAFHAAPPIDLAVHATTRLVAEIPETATNGGILVGDLLLRDASGAPVPDAPVRLRWDGAPSLVTLDNLTTDRQGRINLTRLGLPAAVARADQFALTATFVSTSTYVAGTEAHFAVRIREPVRLVASLTDDSATVGASARVAGTLATRVVDLPGGGRTAAYPLAGTLVKGVLGGVEATARTDESGAFTLAIPVADTVSAGLQSVVVAYAGDDRHEGGQLALPLQVKRTSRIVDLNAIEGPRSLDAMLRGRLVDNQGQGLAGAIRVLSDGAVVATAQSGPDGGFAASVRLGSLKLGTQTLRVQFAGDAGHGPTENATQARVTSSTRLVLEQAPAAVVRGEPVALVARLVDDAGQPVARQAVQATWRGVPVGVAVTDAQGRAGFLVPTNLSERANVATLGAEYAPTGTTVLQPASASTHVRVLAGARLEFEDASVQRGPVAFAGRLLDDEGRPMAAAPVRIHLDGVLLGETRTARNGTFWLPHTLPEDHPLGAWTARATHAGGAHVAPADANATWHVRSPLVVRLEQAGPFVRGEPARFEGRIADDAGRPVDAELVVELDGRSLGTLRAARGVLSGSVPIPADTPRGETRLALRAGVTDRHEAFRLEVPVVVQVRPQIAVDLPPLAVRGLPFGGAVTLRDDAGEPLRNTPFVYVLGATGAPTLGQTDEAGRAQLAGIAPLARDTYLALTVRGGEDVVPTEYKTRALAVVGPATPVGYAALALVALAVVLAIALVALAVVLRRRQLGEVRGILDEAIQDLLAGNEYAGTIFLAYRRLAAHVARHGFAQEAGQTPREFARGVQKALPVGAAPLRELIRLFEEARYSDHVIGGEERDRAIESLARVRNEIDHILGRREVAA